MKYLTLVVFVITFTACNSGKNNKPAAPPSPDSIPMHADVDSITPAPPPRPSSGKIDIESFGEIKLGQHERDMLKAIGKPDSKSEVIEWAADGLQHANWSWKEKGLSIGMSWDKADEENSKIIFSITATAPCAFKTRAGLGIGSSYAEVMAAYKKDIDPEATDKTQITVGSVYGGIIFSFENDKASRIFLGAEAE